MEREKVVISKQDVGELDVSIIKNRGEKMFTTQTGNVTVDLDNKSTPKVEISYRKFEVEPTTSLVEVMEAFGKEGITEEVTTEKNEDGEVVIKSGTISLTQLLADGFNRFSYTQAVSKAKERFNNSPEKTDSNMSKLLQAVIDNPETTDERRKKAQQMLSVLQASA